MTFVSLTDYNSLWWYQPTLKRATKTSKLFGNFRPATSNLFCKKIRLQQSDLLQDRSDSWVVKRATLLPNSFWDNVATQVARFCSLSFTINNKNNNLYLNAVYRIYSINRPGRLLNFWTLRVGAYSRLGAY